MLQQTTTRADIIAAISVSCTNVSKAEARDVLELALVEMFEALTRGECVKLHLFGLFSVRERCGRTRRNPRTGAEVAIEPRRVVSFTPSCRFIDRLNKQEKEWQRQSMAQSFEDFLVDLAGKDDRSVLDRLDDYVRQHLTSYGQASSIELRRVAAEFQIKAPPTLLAKDIDDRLRMLAYADRRPGAPPAV